MEFLFVVTPKGNDEFALTVYQKRPGKTNLVVYSGESVSVSGLQAEAEQAASDITTADPLAPLF